MTYANRSQLPDIGSPADQLYSIHEEINLGERVMHSIASQEGIITDALLSDYIQQIGLRVASGVFDEKPFDKIFPDFSLINHPAINAFAVPGGHIAIFTGLFAVSESEDELCSVVAHEVAHVRLRHYAQRQLKGKESSGASIFGILAGILTAIANPAAGSAILISTIAGSLQTQLKHSRQHEFEADVFGYQYMKKAGYDPQAMIDFHRRLLRLHSQNRDIEYLSTHPVSTNRIGEIAGRIAQDNSIDASQWFQVSRDDTVFRLMKARLLATTEVFRSASLTRLKKEPVLQEYYRSLSAYQDDKVEEAIERLRGLLKQEPENAVFLYSLAEILNAQNRYRESFGYLDRLLLIYPRMVPALLLASDNALKLNKVDLAFRYIVDIDKKHLAYINNLKRLDYLAQAYFKTGNLVSYFLTKADIDFATGHYNSSVYYLRLALNNRYISSEKKEEVQELIDERIVYIEEFRGRSR